jgi:N utilization substance protein B
MAAHPRTLGRELALQYLYMHDSLAGKEVPPLAEYFARTPQPPPPESSEFARKLIALVLDHRGELDQELAVAATNWRLSRMPLVDRNVLRLGLAELMGCPESPVKVVINEAVELARRYSSESACAFVNGILDHLRKKHRPEEEAAAAPEGA